MTATIINIFSASHPSCPPSTRACANCASWNGAESWCENGMPDVQATTAGCTDHQTDREFWQGVENPPPGTAGMRHALKLSGDLRKSIDDHSKRQAVYKTLVALIQEVVDDPSTEARSQRLVGFVDMMTPVIAAGLKSWRGEEHRHA